jgi:hypothetical protein
MPTLNVWVTLVNGVADTTAKDFHRAQKIFHSVPLTFRTVKHTLNKNQTKAILGTDGKLQITGGPNEFDHDIPAGAGGSEPRPVTVKDRDGNFTTEVWAAIRDWTDLGGLHVFYVPEFDPPGPEGGICIRVGDLIDPIIFVSQTANLALLERSHGARGVLEHEIGHAFGLDHTQQSKTLMLGILSSDASDAGTALSRGELQTISNSRLISLASASGQGH